mgnify:CR=1 FL=1
MLTLLLTLAIVGFFVHLIVNHIQMPAIFKQAIIFIAVVLIILYLIRLFNLDIPLPRG